LPRKMPPAAYVQWSGCPGEGSLSEVKGDKLSKKGAQTLQGEIGWPPMRTTILSVRSSRGDRQPFREPERPG